MSHMRKIYLASPHMSENGFEQEYVQQAFETNWIAPLGPNVSSFEDELKEKTGALSVAAVSSGTAAIHLAIKLAGVKPGDKVFCQSLTFSATANPIVYEGAEPIFIDSDIDNWNMSPEALEKAFIKYPEVRVAIVVNLYGNPAKLLELKSICEKHGALLIEDAAESLGSVYNGKSTGTVGDYSIFSFNGNKIITTSGGGALCCNTSNNEDDKAKAIFWATQSKEQRRYYYHKEIGYNYRMSNVAAGIGRGQLKILDERVSKKRYIFDKYKKGFDEIEDISMMPVNASGSISNCWLTSIILNKGTKITPLDIQLELEKYNIEARHIWKPMHSQPIFKNCDYVDNNGTSEDIFKRGLCLPSDTKMTDEDIEFVIGRIKNLFGK